MEDAQMVEPLLTNFTDKIYLITMQMLRIHTVTEGTFGMTIILIEPCGHVSSGEVMSAVGLRKLLYLPTGYTFEILPTVWLGISQTDIEGEYLIELTNNGHLVGGFLLLSSRRLLLFGLVFL